MSLYRSIRLNKLVAFIGSGLSEPYGGPSWSDLAAIMVREVVNNLRELKARGAEASIVESLGNPLRQLLSQEEWAVKDQSEKNAFEVDFSDMNKYGNNLTTIMALCEDILIKIDGHAPKIQAHKRTRKELLKVLRFNSSQSTVSRIFSLFPEIGDTKAREDLLAEFSDGGETIDRVQLYVRLLQNADALDLRLLNPSPALAVPIKGVHSGLQTLDVLHDMGVRRFATLNYDVQIERRFVQRLDEATALQPEAMNALLDPDRHASPGQPPMDVHVQTSTGVSVRSVNLTKSTAADFLKFAVHEDKQETTVFHLHGRVDDPDSAIFTETDYRRRYMSKSGPGVVADEAVRVLYNGNDILFVGTGLKEEDVLGPLRSIMMQNRKPDTDARSSIALMPAGFGEFDEVGEVKGQGQSEARAGNAKEAIHLRQKYGINVIYYGRTDEVFCQTIQLLNAIANALKGGKKYWCEDFGKIRRNIELALPSDASRNIKVELDALELLISTKEGDDFGPDPKSVRRRCAEEIVNVIRSRATARALALELKSIQARSVEWERDWRRTPSERKVRFYVDPKAQSEDPATSYPVWIRHRPAMVHAMDMHTPSAPWLKAKQLAEDLVANASGAGAHPRRSRTVILRVSAARGRGKGAFSRLLFDRARQRDLFGRRRYTGAFIAHMSFSMEFSSVIRALTRFVAGRLAELKAPGDPDLPARWEDAPEEALQDWSDLRLTPTEREEPFRLHRLELLRRLLKVFDIVSQSEPEARLFICLSGVNRLTDVHGDAHSPMHRAFFRLLTGSGEYHPGGGPGNPPIDLVLVAGRPDAPIAYLSEEADEAPVEASTISSHGRRSSSGRVLKIWPTLPAFSWRDRLVFAGADLGRPDPFREAFLTELAGPDGRGVDGPYQHVGRILWNSVALSVWSYLAFQTYIDRKKASSDEAQTQARAWFNELTNASTLDPVRGVVETILKYQYEIIRSEFFKKLDFLKDVSDKEVDTLRDLIVHHLAFFFLPVCTNDLFGCPEIKDAADNIVRRFPYSSKSTTGLRNGAAFEVIFLMARLLARCGLVIEIARSGVGSEAGPEAGVERSRSSCSFVLHDQLREHIARHLNLFVPDGGDRNHFQVSSYTEQPRDTPTPSWDHFKRVTGIVESHVNSGRDTMALFYMLDLRMQKLRMLDENRPPDGAAHDEIEAYNKRHADAVNDVDKVRRQINARLKSPDLAGPVDESRLRPAIECIPQRMRADYAVLRGGFSIGALSRLTPVHSGADAEAPFDKYREWLRRLINAGVGLRQVGESMEAALNGKLDDFVRGKVADSFPIRLRNPFYIDEIAWLLNERGLVSFAQGRLDDAVMHYDRALSIMAHQPSELTNDPAYHSAERRIGLNRAIALIERGDLVIAQKSLTDYRDQCAVGGKSTTSTTLLYAKGYIALCKHISGNIGDVVDQYSAVIRESQKTDRLRAVAIFSRHLSDAMIQLKAYDEARDHLNIAMTAAAHAEQQDVLNLAIISHAKLLLLEGEPKAALEHTLQAEVYGATMGLHNIRAQALSIRARVMLRQGDIEGAGGAATNAIAICKRHGMKLRQFTAMLTYAEVLYARGEEGMARAVVEFAKRGAEQIRLQSKVARAQRLLAQFDFNAPLSPNARLANGRTTNAW